MSEIRKRIERAAGEGLFDHPFILNSWAYEGTATMKPPLLGIPENMKKAHDNCIAFVINRCYQHSLDDPCCKINAEYAEVVREWGRMTSDLALWGGEYYNVSRHEDLPLLFMDNMKRSMRFYHESGAKGITYMHTPITGWSVRAMTQMLHSLLAWNIDADTEVASSEFFHLRYGCHADSMKKVYGYIEEASEPVAEWRAWRHSILCQMYSSFDGDNVDTPLGFRHYASHAEAVADGEKCAVLYQKAWETIADEFEKEKDLASGDFHLIAPENPDQAYASKTYDRIANALAEDLRLVNYGHDVMEIMTLVVAYYDACFRKCEPEKEAIWIRIREQERLMQAYTILVVYNAWKPFHECRDALTRSQMRQAINAIRKQRLMHRRKCVIEKNVPKKMCHDTLEIETKGDVY